VKDTEINEGKTTQIKTNEETEQEKKTNLNIKFDPFDARGLLSYIRHPIRLFFLNVLAGIGRGLGFAIGFTILAALIIFFLRRIVNIPIIGKFIAQILDVVQEQRTLFH
jgi:Domain of unknown function (DUF5665)